MSIFAVFKASKAFDQGMTNRGINPRGLPATLQGKICSYASQRNSYSGDDALVAAVAVATQYAACCILGPTKFLASGGSKDYCDIESIAGWWYSGGPDSTMETAIVRAVNDAGLLSREYANIFMSFGRK